MSDLLKSIESARKQYDTEECQHTKQRLKKFILTKCSELEKKGIDCINLYFDLQDKSIEISKKSKAMLIDASEFKRLVKSDETVAELQRQVNKLKIREQNLIDKVKEYDELLKKKGETNIVKMREAHAAIQSSLHKKINELMKSVPNSEIKTVSNEKYSNIVRCKNEYEAELKMYKNAFAELKVLALAKNTPEILMIIQKCYIDIDNARADLRNKTGEDNGTS